MKTRKLVSLAVATLLIGLISVIAPAVTAQSSIQGDEMVCPGSSDFGGLVVTDEDDCYEDGAAPNDANGDDEGDDEDSDQGDNDAASGCDDDVYMDGSTAFCDVEEAQAFCISKTVADTHYDADDCLGRWEILTEGNIPQVAHLQDGVAVTIVIDEGYYAQVWPCKSQRDLPLYVVGPSRIHVACQAAVRKYDIYSGDKPDSDSFIYVGPYDGEVSSDEGDDDANEGDNDDDADNDADEDADAGNDEDEDTDNAETGNDCTEAAVVEVAGGTDWNAVTSGGFQGTPAHDFEIPDGMAVVTSADPNTPQTEGEVAGNQLVTVYPCHSR